jgi:hypothetical protein
MNAVLLAPILWCALTWAFPAQIAVEEKHKFNHDVRSVIRTERRQWNRYSETVICGTIENLTDGPLELEVDPALYLSSRTSSEMSDKF